MTDHCRSCGVEVVWAANDRTGREAPIDAEPSIDGNVLLLRDGRYHVLGRGDPTPSADTPRHKNHWQTCPDRAAWREELGRRAALGQSDGKPRPMTKPQKDFVQALQRKLSLPDRMLEDHCQATFRRRLAELDVRQASDLIEELKGWEAIPADMQRAAGQIDLF